MLWNRANQLVPGSPTAVTFDTKLGRGERVVVLCVGVRECVFPSITSRPRRQSGIYLFFFVGTRNMLPSSAPTEQPKSLEETFFFLCVEITGFFCVAVFRRMMALICRVKVLSAVWHGVGFF